MTGRKFTKVFFIGAHSRFQNYANPTGKWMGEGSSKLRYDYTSGFARVHHNPFMHSSSTFFKICLQTIVSLNWQFIGVGIGNGMLSVIAGFSLFHVARCVFLL
jgi:hypothetical protein